MNLADAGLMAGTLESVGYICAKTASEADAIYTIVTRCAVRVQYEVSA